jgi:hypothetical protein
MSTFYSSSLFLPIQSKSINDDPLIRKEMNDVLDALRILQGELTRFRQIVTFSDAVVPGQLVAVYNNAGTFTARLASAANNTKQAVGFTVEAVAIGGTSSIILLGSNPYLSGLTLGSQYYLSDVTAGAITAIKPVGAGKIVQPVGFAVSATELQFYPNNNWTQL